MINYKIFKNTMSIDNGKCHIYIGCDDTEVFNELHETVDRILKKHYADKCEVAGEVEELSKIEK